MPIYEYVCQACHEKCSLLQRMGANEKETVCPNCGSSEVSRQISAFSCSHGGGSASSGSAGGFSGG